MPRTFRNAAVGAISTALIAFSVPSFAADDLASVSVQLDRLGLTDAALPLDDAFMEQHRGAGFAEALAAILAGLPEENTVSATINDSPTVTNSGPGDQTFSSTTPGTTVELSASSSGATTTTTSFSSVTSLSTTRTRTATFSFFSF